MHDTAFLRSCFRLALIGALLGPALPGCTGASSEAGPRTVRPGAPGQPTRVVAAEGEPEAPRYTEADVRFIEDMIVHHAQALEMTALVPARTESEDIRRIARRIELSQTSEIALMNGWLAQRGESMRMDAVDNTNEPRTEPRMAGMLTAEEMEGLRDAAGAEFERRFLELMIRHHEGALAMVDVLLSTPGAAQDTEVFQLASHVEADQASEIARMRAMRAALD